MKPTGMRQADRIHDVPRIAAIGVRGYAGTHIRSIIELELGGAVHFVGACDLDATAQSDLPRHVVFSTDYRQLLADLRPDITVIATPPHTHYEIAMAATAVGSDLLLEKPPLVSLQQHRELTYALRRTGTVCQVGFQTLTSPGITTLMDLTTTGELGTLTGVTASGAWIRTSAYYERSRWSGRRYLDGTVVADGAATNPFAHLVMNALALVAAAHPEATPTMLEAEMYRCGDIETDDTASARIHFDNGCWIVLALTLRAQHIRPPQITIHGTVRNATHNAAGTNEVEIAKPPSLGATQNHQHAEPRANFAENLLKNLINNRRSPETTSLLIPLDRTANFTAFLEAVMNTTVHRIPETFLESGHPSPLRDTDRRISIKGINQAIGEAAATASLFSELDLPWSRPPSTLPLDQP